MTVIGLFTPVAVFSKPIHASNDPVRDEPAITAEDREHWAFRPLHQPALPPVKDGSRLRNEVDAFIQARLEAQGLTLLPEAGPTVLIRRLNFDLTGLPPTAEEVKAFIKSSQSDPDAAYRALVERLLASERHGEAWAQPWLDLARFAESDGFEHDLERRHAWKYRDWVVASLNRDLRYDKFVEMQIAGDELPGGEAIATGFLFAGPDMPDLNAQDERRSQLLNNITGTVGSAFLGVTLGCAQCHDHPYDPLSQADFYRLRACFDNLPELKRDKQLPPGYVEAGTAPVPSHVNIRGDHLRAGPEVRAAFPRIANPEDAALSPQPAANSSGQRSALAAWLTRPANGLFLRTSVNRIWQQHFGRPLCGSPGDLGIKGETPTHPELLEWLAAELPKRGWSLKAMHRLIVLSAAYRQAPAMGGGGDHGLFAGFPRRRLTGEELRDAQLAVAGRLNLKSGGESVRLPLPPEVSGTLLKKHYKVTADTTDHDRRSIYTFARRILRHPMFDVFDRPDAMASCSRRGLSVTATQSLTLLNSGFSQDMAASLASRLSAPDSDPSRIIDEATWICFSRAPTAEEVQRDTTFLARQAALAPSFQAAVSDYCLALMNASEFSWID